MARFTATNDFPVPPFVPRTIIFLAIYLFFLRSIDILLPLKSFIFNAQLNKFICTLTGINILRFIIY